MTKYPWQDRFDPEREFVVVKPRRVNGVRLAPGEPFDKTSVNRRTLRTFYEARIIAVKEDYVKIFRQPNPHEDVGPPEDPAPPSDGVPSLQDQARELLREADDMPAAEVRAAYTALTGKDVTSKRAAIEGLRRIVSGESA